MRKPEEEPGELPEPIDANAEEKQALQKVIMRSFAANPPTVKFFGKTRISWNVIIPANSSIGIDLKLNEGVVLPTGSVDVSPRSRTEFKLVAATENEERFLGKLTVNVDPPEECKSELVVPDFVFTGGIPAIPSMKSKTDDQFKGISEIKLRGNGSTVTLGDGVLSISIPLEIEVPLWFNADMDIDVRLEIIGREMKFDTEKRVWIGPAVLIRLKHFSVDVSWTFLEHLAGALVSKVCMGAMQEGMQRMAEVLLRQLLFLHVLPQMTQDFTGPVLDSLTRMQQDDPQHRLYQLYSSSLGPGGFSVTACPNPNL